MRKMNRNGFTLVELLATLVILGLLMGVAAPNILGVISKNRNITYVEDAQKLVSRAEYVLRSDPKITKPGNNTCVGFTLGYLDNSEFLNTPYGGHYYANYSIVVVKRQMGEYKYYVQLVESLPATKSDIAANRGIVLMDVDTLANSKPGEYVKNMDDLSNLMNLSKSTRNNFSFENCSLVNNNLSVYSDDITYEKANAEVTRNVKTDSDEVPNDSETSEDPEG